MDSKLEVRISEAVCGLRHRMASTEPDAEHAYRCCDSRDCDYKIIGERSNTMYCSYAPARTASAENGGAAEKGYLAAKKLVTLSVGGSLMPSYAFK